MIILSLLAGLPLPFIERAVRKTTVMNHFEAAAGACRSCTHRCCTYLRPASDPYPRNLLAAVLPTLVADQHFSDLPPKQPHKKGSQGSLHESAGVNLESVSFLLFPSSSLLPTEGKTACCFRPNLPRPYISEMELKNLKHLAFARSRQPILTKQTPDSRGRVVAPSWLFGATEFAVRNTTGLRLPPTACEVAVSRPLRVESVSRWAWPELPKQLCVRKKPFNLPYVWKGFDLVLVSAQSRCCLVLLFTLGTQKSHRAWESQGSSRVSARSVSVGYPGCQSNRLRKLLAFLNRDQNPFQKTFIVLRQNGRVPPV